MHSYAEPFISSLGPFTDAIIKKHHLDLVHEEDAERFWKMEPEKDNFVISFATVATLPSN